MNDLPTDLVEDLDRLLADLVEDLDRLLAAKEIPQYIYDKWVTERIQIWNAVSRHTEMLKQINAQSATNTAALSKLVDTLTHKG